MNKYIGVKIISAEPAQATEDDRRGQHPVGAEGYKVVYEDGYTSWSPKEVFDSAYRQTDGLTFGLAIEALKLGKKVARSGWNGKGMYLLYVPGTPDAKLQPGTPYYKNLPNDWASVEGENPVAEILPHIDMWTINAQGRRAFLPGWLASQSDMLADDWVIVD